MNKVHHILNVQMHLRFLDCGYLYTIHVTTQDSKFHTIILFIYY